MHFVTETYIDISLILNIALYFSFDLFIKWENKLPILKYFTWDLGKHLEE